MTEKKNLIFERAGIMKLTARNSLGVLSKDTKEIYISNQRIVQSISSSFSKETNPIDSGNSHYPADVRTTKSGGKIDVGLNAYDRQLFRFGMGASVVEDANGFIGITDNYAIPEDGVLVLDNKLYSIESVIVKGSTEDVDYIAAEDVTQTGGYKVDLAANAITFSSVDAGKGVIISALFEAETTADVLSKIPKDTTYQLEIFGKVAQLKGTTDELFDHIIFDSVKFSGEFKPPAKKIQSEAWTVSFEVVEPTGDKVMDWKYANKDAIKKFTPPLVTVSVAITETNSKVITVKDSTSKAVTATGGKYTLTVGETYMVSSTGYVDQTFVATAGMTTKSITLVAV